MGRLVQWNPNLKSDCSNLLLGEAYMIALVLSDVAWLTDLVRYCVDGPAAGSTASATATTS